MSAHGPENESSVITERGEEVFSPFAALFSFILFLAIAPSVRVVTEGTGDDGDPMMNREMPPGAGHYH